MPEYEKYTDFATITEAGTWYLNSGFLNWEWFEGFDEKELIRFARMNGASDKTENSLVREFLLSKEQNPGDYGL